MPPAMWGERYLEGAMTRVGQDEAVFESEGVEVFGRRVEGAGPEHDLRFVALSQPCRKWVGGCICRAAGCRRRHRVATGLRGGG